MPDRLTRLVDASGWSKISVQDYAVAMIDELEKARAYSPTLHSWVLISRGLKRAHTILISRFIAVR